ncbi:hypothetical protein TcasGA2_TC031081 [Tribolium castaneum]|nr:hypothetical protein TcasGA2_TC031081 [Tribolium castaneum]
MKKLNYTVEISYDLEEGVKTAHCTCPRGNVACHHMAAALYYAHYNVSATDIECQWSAPSKTTPQTEVIKLADVYKPKLSNYTALSRSSTEDEIIQFRAEIGVTNVVGFTWLLRPEASEEARKIIADIEEILQSLEYVQAIDKQKFLLEKCRIDEARIKLVEACTRGQHVNENWHVARKHRLTASRFGMVLSACSRRRFPPSLFKNLAEGYSLDRVAAVQWGKTHEKTALREFEEATNLKVQETGFWLEESGFLGASPDGLVEEDGILEIKCPYKYRDTDSLSEALKDKKYFYWRDENEDINLNSNHNYYHQVQGQMHITGRTIFGNKKSLRPGVDDEKLLELLNADCSDIDISDEENELDPEPEEIFNDELQNEQTEEEEANDQREEREDSEEDDDEDDLLPLSVVRDNLLVAQAQNSTSKAKRTSWKRKSTFTPPNFDWTEPENDFERRLAWTAKDYLSI